MAALKVEWAMAEKTLPGQTEMGDALWMHASQPGLLRLGVIDGLGHGGEAAVASAAAVACLGTGPLEKLDDQMRACHEALRGTRGAAISLASLDLESGRMAWSGIGNVEGALLRQGPKGPVKERLLLKSGIVGYNLPEPRVGELPLLSGDWLVFVTDGIKSEFLDGFDFNRAPEEAAGAILGRFLKGWDDALVWVGRLSS